MERRPVVVVDVRVAVGESPALLGNDLQLHHRLLPALPAAAALVVGGKGRGGGRGGLKAGGDEAVNVVGVKAVNG